MKKVLCGFALALVGCVMGGGLSTEVNAQVALPTAPAAPATLDVVTLKNGSVIYGEVIEMAGGVLQIKTPASPDNLHESELERRIEAVGQSPRPLSSEGRVRDYGDRHSRTRWDVECPGRTLERHDGSSDGLCDVHESRHSTPGHLLRQCRGCLLPNDRKQPLAQCQLAWRFRGAERTAPAHRLTVVTSTARTTIPLWLATHAGPSSSTSL